MAKYLVLTPERETELSALIAAGDTGAVHELALGARAWATTEVKRFVGQGVDWDDLVSEAYIGLVNAATRYDSAKGRFAAFSTLYVRSALSDAVRLQGRAVAIPEHAFEAEVAERRGNRSDRLDRFSSQADDSRAWRTPTALDAPLSSEGATTAADLLVSDSRGTEQGVVETLFLNGLLNEVTEMERQVLLARYELPGAVSGPIQAAIAVALGVSRGRVAQLEKQALAKLRKSILVVA